MGNVPQVLPPKPLAAIRKKVRLGSTPESAANVVIKSASLRIMGRVAEMPLADERRQVAGRMKHFGQCLLTRRKIGDSNWRDKLAITRRILRCLAPDGHV